MRLLSFFVLFAVACWGQTAGTSLDVAALAEKVGPGVVSLSVRDAAGKEIALGTPSCRVMDAL